MSQEQSGEENTTIEGDTLGDLLGEGYEGLAKKYKTPQDLAKAYQSLSQKLSSTARVPDANAPVEEWGEFYSKLGRPETPHGYDLPEGEKARAALDPLTKAAHAAGLTKKQWDKLHPVAQEQLVRDESAEKEQLDKAREEWQEGARRRYGEGLEEKLALAKRSLDTLTSENPDIQQVLSKTGLVDHPAILDMMIERGNSMSDDSTPTNAVSDTGGETDPMKIAQKIRSMMKDSAHTDPRHKDAEVHREEYYRLLGELATLGYEGVYDDRLKPRF